MKHTLTYRIILATAILLQAFLVSCTQVEFAGMVESFDGMENFSKSNRSKVLFNVLLPEGIAEEDAPEFMTVLMNRARTEVCRYIYNLDSNGQAIETESDSLIVNDGYYLISSIAGGSKEDFEITQIDSFKVNEALSMGDMFVAIPKLNTASIIEQGYIDFNPKYPYIRSIEPLYMVRPEQSNGESIFSYRRKQEGAGEEHVINLNYKQLTRRLSVDLELEIGEGVDVSRVICTLSGVPQKVNILNGTVKQKDICKVPFELSHMGDGLYKGNIDVLGLFSHMTEDKLIVGPGVLNVIIHVSTVANGRTIKRILYNNYNLKNQIDAAELMVPTEDGTAYYFNDRAKSTSFSLGKVSSITKEDIIVGAGQGCEVWEGSDEDDDKNINPGLNPEI